MANWTIIPAARDELDRAYGYYLTHAGPRTADEFFDELIDAIRKIAANPLLWPADEDDDYRFFVLRRHSYVIHYRMEGSHDVRIVAVRHSSQQPDIWKGR